MPRKPHDDGDDDAPGADARPVLHEPVRRERSRERLVDPEAEEGAEAGREAATLAVGRDRDEDAALRPRTFDEFVGQKKIVENLSVYVQAAKRRGDALDHVLLAGPPGLGKTTLAFLLAREMGTEIRVTSGPALERKGD